MPQALSADLEAVITRIAAPTPATGSTAGPRTGELARLLCWWTSVSDGAAPRTTTLISADSSDVRSALRAGMAAADRAIDAGATLLVPRAARRQPVAALSVISVLTRSDASAITYQSVGMTDRAWMERCAAVRDAGVDLVDLRSAPVDLLESLAADGLAFVAGALLAGAARRTASIVEGTEELAAALVADRLSFRAKDWWRAGSTSTDPARQAAVDRLNLDAGLPLALTDDEGHGADATVALIDLLARQS